MAEKGKGGILWIRWRKGCFGAAVLSRGCPLPRHPSIGSGFGWQQKSWMKWECLFWRRKAGTYSVTGVERISGDPASGPAMDRAEVGKKENEQYKGSIQADSENIGTKEVSLEERKIEEIHAEEPAPEILYEIELESDADDSFPSFARRTSSFQGLARYAARQFER